MTQKRNESDKDKAQVAAFRKAARELGCDESEERFQEALRKVAKPAHGKRDAGDKTKR
jgi:hypothetical protein